MNANETVVVVARPFPIRFMAHTRNIRTVSVTVRWEDVAKPASQQHPVM